MNPLEAERTRIQAELDARRTRRQRNVMGQFATPGPLAVEMLRSARDLTRGRTGGLRFMDPAFGTGSFYSALLSVFDRESVAVAFGYEIDPHYGLPAARLWEPSGLRLDLTDFTACRPGDNGGERVDLLVCNPPYVRHHHIERATKLRLGRKVTEQLGIRVSGLAGLYVYFMLLSHRWLRPDGLSVWLVPSEFMDVNYGSALKEYLLNRVDLLRIHRFEPSEVQFEDALVSSAVVWFRKRAPAPGSVPEFTLGGSLARPRLKRRLIRPGALPQDVAGVRRHEWGVALITRMMDRAVRSGSVNGSREYSVIRSGADQHAGSASCQAVGPAEEESLGGSCKTVSRSKGETG